MASSKGIRIVEWITSILILLTGILFIVCCSHLYFTGGDQPYSRERVADYLVAPAISGGITLLLAIGGMIYALIVNVKNDNITPRTKIELLESFAKRYDIKDFEGESKAKILKERKAREIFKYISYSFSAAVFLLVLIYLCFFAEFTIDHLNADVIAALGVALPLSSIGLGIHVARLFVAESSAARELELIKSYIKENPSVKAIKVAKGEKKRFDYIVFTRCAILTVAIVFVVVGIFNGGMRDVLAKGVKICTECIGLG